MRIWLQNNIFRRLLAITLIMVLMVTLIPIQAFAKEEDDNGAQIENEFGVDLQDLNITIAAFDELDDYTLWQGYDYGEIRSQGELDLTVVLTGTDVDDNSVTISGVTWQSTPAFDPDVGDMEYIFSATLPQCQEINMVYLSIYCDFPD